MSLPEFKLLRPRSVEEAVGLLGQQAQTIRVLAGGTDMIPSMRQKLFEPQSMLDVRHLSQLKGIHTRAGQGVEIGALTTLREIEQSAFLRKHYPVLTEAAATVASPVLRNMLAQKKKIPGFGHRVYHTEDPRATHLRTMSRDLGNSSGNPKWFEYSHKIEEFVKADKKLNANVDFYSASTYHTLGIEVDLFTPIFAISRMSGWGAHVIEQLDDNRLIRPRADYMQSKTDNAEANHREPVNGN